jgi:PPOX class probable F420-dependent enzyme
MLAESNWLFFSPAFAEFSQESIMSAKIPENFMDLFQKKAFGSLSTLMPDGSPQTNPVWVDYDNGEVWVNTAVGRLKDRNMKRDPRVSVAVIDPDNPYRFVEIRGKVRQVTQEGATQHIDKMAKKYLGKDKYPFAQAGEQRVLFKIKPEHVHTMG